MSLSEYLAKNNIRQEDFASKIGVTQATVSRLSNGGVPSLKLAVAIERATRGRVKASSWASQAVSQ